MRVLHLYSGNLFGGIERVLLTLWTCRDACPDLRSHFALGFDEKLARDLRAAGATVTLLGPARVSRPWTVAAARRRLGDLLHREPFDVAITHSFWPHGLFAPVVRSARLPLVMWMHDVPSGRGWLEAWAKRVTPDRLIAGSRFIAARASRMFEFVACDVQYPPMEVHHSTRRADGAGGVVILMCGRVQPGKGHHILLEALGHLCDEPGWTCRIAGTPQRRGERQYLVQLEARARALGIESRVQFLGHRDDIPQLLAGADIFCHPHVAPEGFGLAIAEALAAGVPVVCSALGGPTELVNGACGLLVEPGDAKGLATALRALLRDAELRSRLARDARLRGSHIAQGGSLESLHRALCRAVHATDRRAMEVTPA